MTLYSRKGDDISRGLVGFWKLDDLKAGPEITTAIDQVNFNDGTIIGATNTDGVNGLNPYATNFDGVEDWIDFGTFIPAVVSISFWLNFNAGEEGPIVYNGEDNFNSGVWDWSFFATGGTLKADGGSGGGAVAEVISSGVWNHWVMIRDDGLGNMLVYKNGALVVTDSGVNGSGTTPGRKLMIAKAGTTFANFKMQNLRLYNRVINTGEVSKLFRTRQ